MIEVNFDENKFAKIIAKAVLFGKDVDKAITLAAKRAADTGKAETKRQLVKRYTFPSSEIGNTIFSRHIHAGAVLRISSPVFSLSEFKGTKFKKPPFAKVKKDGGEQLTEGAFAATMKTGHTGIWEREGEKRRDKDMSGKLKSEGPLKWHIKELFGPSTSGMVRANEDVQNAIIDNITETLDKATSKNPQKAMQNKRSQKKYQIFDNVK